MNAASSSQLVIPGSTGAAPVVSIMIPTFRRPDLLLAAVRSALAQETSFEFEVVVVDNDPTPGRIDELLAELQDPRLTLYRNVTNLGMFGNWNQCLALARGDWLTLLNDDDLLDPDYLTSMMRVVAAHPDIVMAACRSRVLDERESAHTGLFHRLTTAVRQRRHDRLEGQLVRLTTQDYFLNNPHQGSLGILMQRDAALAQGGFDAAWFPSADYCFFARLQKPHGCALLQRTLATYRVLANESRNAQVAASWVEQGLKLRRELAPAVRAPQWLLEAYARLLAIQNARYFKAYWKSDLDVSATLARHGLPNLPVHGLVLITRALLVRIVFPSRDR